MAKVRLVVKAPAGEEDKLLRAAGFDRVMSFKTSPSDVVEVVLTVLNVSAALVTLAQAVGPVRDVAASVVGWRRTSGSEGTLIQVDGPSGTVEVDLSEVTESELASAIESIL